MSGRVILVRHAMPETERGIAPSRWRLGESAKEDCVLLAHALPKALAGAVYTSDEAKARETATIIALRRGLRVVEDARLREVDRPLEWLDDHREAVREYLGEGRRPGWEPPLRVASRFSAAVGAARATEPEGDLVVVDHGMALSLYASRHVEMDVVEFWERLTFPDAWAVNVEMGTIERVFMGGIAGE